MPIYEYRCEDCGIQFERLASWKDAQQVSCSECDSPNVKRLLSIFATLIPSSAGEKSRPLSALPTCTTGTCDW